MYGQERATPITVYRGAEDGPTLWLNGATHGDEPEGPFSIFLALRDLDPKELKGTVVAVPVMNVEAFKVGQRGDPADTFSYDMNRIYPGKPDGYPTERVAYAHWEAMKHTCDLQIAVHSGGEHSYLGAHDFRLGQSCKLGNSQGRWVRSGIWFFAAARVAAIRVRWSEAWAKAASRWNWAATAAC